MIDLDEARCRVLEALEPMPPQPVAIGRAAGRVLAEAVHARDPLPPFASSAMDGFAVTPGPAGRRMAVVDESRAGRPARRATSAQAAIRISTGAPLPDGATAVIPLERVEEESEEITLLAAVGDGDHVRRAGEELAAGVLALAPGLRLGPVELGVAASAGRAELHCVRRPRVEVLVTGDELIPAGDPLGPGQIPESNGLVLAAAARAAGAQATTRPPVADDPAVTRRRLADALQRCDVLVVCGGVSVGPHDHVRPALAALDVSECFWRVALKPGKPIWFGRRAEQLVFGLPGNPVSALVCFWLFVAPALRALGGGVALPGRGRARLGDSVPPAPGRLQAIRVRLEPTGELPLAQPTGPQDSHRLTSMLGADALALVPASNAPTPAGTEVAIELVSTLAGA